MLGLREKPLAQKGVNRKVGAFQCWGADTLGRLRPFGVRSIDGNNVDAVGGNGSSSMALQYRLVRQNILRHCFRDIAARLPALSEALSAPMFCVLRFTNYRCERC
jgi:hypothetical protein